jgi:HlyD family secretion protein
MKKSLLLIPVIATVLLAGCKSSNSNFDAAGSFESVETIISTEASGTILQFNVEEGQMLQVNQLVGYIDSTQLYLKKKQLEAQIASTTSQLPNIPVQVASLNAQLEQAKKNQQRMANLFKADAATQQQLDNANTQVDVLEKQINAQESTMGISSSTLTKTTEPIERQIEQINDQIKKCRIVNPLYGRVLTKYAETHEITGPGKALYKIAQTDTLILRAYVTGSQLSQIKLGQTIKVMADKGAKEFSEYNGIIFWVSDKSEFTPKTIPTKDERADLVYAVKIRVVNDGFLKIGMYGQVKF